MNYGSISLKCLCITFKLQSVSQYYFITLEVKPLRKSNRTYDCSEGQQRAIVIQWIQCRSGDGLFIANTTRDIKFCFICLHTADYFTACVQNVRPQHARMLRVVHGARHLSTDASMTRSSSSSSVVAQQWAWPFTAGCHGSARQYTWLVDER